MSLSDILINERLQPEVAKTISDARAEGLEGEQLLQTLVYTGMSNGVDMAERAFTTASRQLLTQYKEGIKAMQAAVQKSSDIESIQAINEVAEHFQVQIKKHVESLTSFYAKEMETLFNIPPKYSSNDIPLVAIPIMDLLRIAQRTHAKDPASFYGWAIASRKGEIHKMKCACGMCLRGSMVEFKSEAEEIELLLQKYSSFDQCYYDYAKFLITQARDVYASLLEGVASSVHGAQSEQSTDGMDVVKSMLAKLRINPKP